jgi:2-haloacid dehalogenase
MLGGAIEDAVSLLRQLENKEYRLLGLTNWSNQTFPIAWESYDFLKIFEGIVVSGDEKIIKPDPLIYQLIVNRYDLVPEKCIFIDDSEKNISAAREIGIKGILFKNAKGLKRDLKLMGIPIS